MAGFKKAERKQSKLRCALDGPSGSGKSYSALRLAFGLVGAGLAKRVAVIDTEHGSAAKYAGENPDGVPFEFDVMELDNFSPLAYVAGLEDAHAGGYDVVVVDSLTHAWSGAGGALDIVDKKAAQSQGNKFVAWRDVTPMHNRLVNALVQAPFHVVGTLRTKTEYVLETNDRGKQVPRKVGTAPIQRDGMEYEFDVYASLDLSHHITVGKTRCSAMDGAADEKPGPRFWRPLFAWLAGGVPEEPKAKPNGHADKPTAYTAGDLAAKWWRGTHTPDNFAAAVKWVDKELAKLPGYVAGDLVGCVTDQCGAEPPRDAAGVTHARGVVQMYLDKFAGVQS